MREPSPRRDSDRCGASAGPAAARKSPVASHRAAQRRPGPLPGQKFQWGCVGLSRLTQSDLCESRSVFESPNSASVTGGSEGTVMDGALLPVVPESEFKPPRDDASGLRVGRRAGFEDQAYCATVPGYTVPAAARATDLEPAPGCQAVASESRARAVCCRRQWSLANRRVIS